MRAIATMKRRKITMLLLALGILIVALLFAFRARETRYAGRPLSFWLEQINEAGSIESCEPALDAIRSMDGDALPFLLKNIAEGEHSWFERQMFDLVKRFPKMGDLLPASTRNQSPTCLALKTLGTNCAPIVPELGRMAADPKTTRWAALALFSIGPPAVPGLEIACASPVQAIRANAAHFLCKVYDGEHREWAWGWNTGAGGKRTFGVGTMWDEDDVRALTKLLKHADPSVRRACAEALQLHHSIDGATALPELKRAMEDADAGVQRAASDAVAEIEDYLRRKTARGESL